MTPWEWFYADDEDAEVWHKASSREDAIKQGRDLYGPVPFIISEAQRAPLTDDVFSADDGIDLFETWNDDKLNPNEPTPDISPEAQQELADALNAAFAAWRAKWNPWTAFAFADQRNIEVIEPETAA